MTLNKTFRAGLLITLMIIFVTAFVITVKPNMPLPTLGGMQFWTDEMLSGGWRIQRHARTGHCRVLDENNVRRHWGYGRDCLNNFQSMTQKDQTPPNPKQLVLMVHGLGGYGWTFRKLRPYLREKSIPAAQWNYASTQADLAAILAAFHQTMNSLEGVEDIVIVTHSLGGILMRLALDDRTQAWRERINIAGVIMVGTPNQGATLADRFSKTLWYQTLLGSGGQTLTSRASKNIPTPSYPFCLIAGRLDGEGNPLIPGEDDGMVGVAQTRIEHGPDPLVIENSHMMLLANPMTLNLIKDWTAAMFDGARDPSAHCHFIRII